MKKVEDITPKESVVPVYSVIYTKDDEQYIELESESQNPEQKMVEQQAIKDSALIKLQRIGLTEEEAKAIIGV